MKEKLLIFKDDKINLKTEINILILVFIFSGIFGFIYETIFYRIDLGYFTKRGSTFGPWIPIYAFGSLLIMFIAYRFRKHPVVVFFMSCIITGVLEYFTGYVLYEFMGIRLWDYNTEIWNFGNINGYICLRSVFFFGLSSLFLIYAMVPMLKKIALKFQERKLSITCYTICFIFILDMILHALLK